MVKNLSPLCTISLDHTVCVKFFVKINIIKFVNSAKIIHSGLHHPSENREQKGHNCGGKHNTAVDFFHYVPNFFLYCLFYPKITAQKMDVEPAK